jgi:hypothetical protein
MGLFARRKAVKQTTQELEDVRALAPEWFDLAFYRGQVHAGLHSRQLRADVQYMEEHGAKPGHGAAPLAAARAKEGADQFRAAWHNEGRGWLTEDQMKAFRGGFYLGYLGRVNKFLSGKEATPE